VAARWLQQGKASFSNYGLVHLGTFHTHGIVNTQQLVSDARLLGWEQFLTFVKLVTELSFIFFLSS